MDRNAVIQLANAVIDTEIEAIQSLKKNIDGSFITACDHILQCKGRIVVLGMGKSGHVASKIAATMASTGTPAFYVHPGEASHGDLGMITVEDVVLMLSNSGETEELLIIVPVIKRLNIPLIVMTGKKQSRLATCSDVLLYVEVDKEACPLGLAPTSSTTASMVLGDALAVALLESRGFTKEDFARSHPAGKLGRRLLLHINDIMHVGNKIPLINQTATMSEALVEMSSKGFGIGIIVNATKKIIGVLTDGDIRRMLNKDLDLHQALITEIMTECPITVLESDLAVTGVKLMEQHKINALPVINIEKQVVGVLNFHDLLIAGVV